MLRRDGREELQPRQEHREGERLACRQFSSIAAPRPAVPCSRQVNHTLSARNPRESRARNRRARVCRRRRRDGRERDRAARWRTPRGGGRRRGPGRSRRRTGREPLVEIEGDRVRPLDAGEARPELRAQSRRGRRTRRRRGTTGPRPRERGDAGEVVDRAGVHAARRPDDQERPRRRGDRRRSRGRGAASRRRAASSGSEPESVGAEAGHLHRLGDTAMHRLRGIGRQAGRVVEACRAHRSAEGRAPRRPR